MKKLDFSTFTTYFKYCQFWFIHIDNMRGYAYKLCAPLTAHEKNFLQSFENVRLLKSHPQYAPEQRAEVVFIRGYK